MSGPLEERDEQQFYASERLKDCQHMILRMAQSLVVQRARVEKARSAGLAAARDAYSDLQEVRGYLLEALSGPVSWRWRSTSWLLPRDNSTRGLHTSI